MGAARKSRPSYGRRLPPEAARDTSTELSARIISRLLGLGFAPTGATQNHRMPPGGLWQAPLAVAGSEAVDGVAEAEALRHVRWIGGGTVTGKTTIARSLAARHGLHLYECDRMQSAHTARSNRADHPLLFQFMEMSMDERWATRTPEEMYETWPAANGEGFHLIVEDLLDVPPDRPVLVEGYKLLPRLVNPLLTSSHQAVWLIPAPEFRRVGLKLRGTLWDMANQTSDPERALANRLARDAMLTSEVARQAEELALPTITVDGISSLDEVTARVADALGLDWSSDERR